MSEEQEKAVETLIKEARLAKQTYSAVIKMFAATILIAVSTLSALTWQATKNGRDIDYVRENAVNKKAFINLIDTYKINSESLTKLIGNPDIKAVIDDFNAKTDAIVNRMIASETKIVPRGTEFTNSKRLNK